MQAPPGLSDQLDEEREGPSGGPPLKYDGVSNFIPGLPTRAQFAKESGLAKQLEQQIRDKRVFFMPNDVKEDNQYIEGVPTYTLWLYGALINGSKALVKLRNIDIYFDVRVPDGVTPRALGAELAKAVQPLRIEDVLAFPLHGFKKVRVAWKRVYFLNSLARKKALEIVRSQEFETASDDRSNLFRMVARVYQKVLTDWGLLTNFTHRGGGAIPNAPAVPLCEYVFCLDIADYVSPAEDPPASDRSLVLTWDIETYDSGRTGELPLASNPKAKVFMIGLTAHWKDDTAALCRVCLVDTPSAPDSRWITVECANEAELVKAFAVVFRHLAPDFIVGFNDGGYDWPFVLEKARQYGLLSFMAELTSARGSRPAAEDKAWDWNVCREKRIKIDAGVTASVTFWKVPGSIPIDVRVMFLQLFPKAEVGKGSSLDFYLKSCNLAKKADMPHTRLWEIYAAKDVARMRQVAHYCVTDANRCQELLVKRNVINDRREEANLSYVSIYDALFYARGHKVCNMVNAHAFRRGILCTSINNPDVAHCQYPGAWVFHPEKGLVPDPRGPGVEALEAARAKLLDKTGSGAEVERALDGYSPGRPVAGLDFASLYPSLIMTYNFSPEKFVATAAEAEALEADGHVLHCTRFQFEGAERVGWFVRHGGAREGYGLYPSVLLDLLDRRVLLKKQLALLEKRKEYMELAMLAVETEASAKNLPKAAAAPAVFARERAAAQHAYLGPIVAKPAKAQYEAFQTLYRDTCFQCTAIDSRQKARKVLMNVFYGETGSQISPLFNRTLAAGVTTSGQDNIKKVAEFVRALSFRIKYGDTDSLYVTPPDRVFAGLDRQYGFGELSKPAYWAAMVELTMAELDGLRDAVNALLKSDNGTEHLRMAYEEVIFPYIFMCKKKYCGIAHVSTPNFFPKSLFIRGVDVVKQGQPDYVRRIGMRIMWAAVSLTNTKSVLAIVEDTLRDAIERSDQWAFDDFVQSAAWKPERDNKAVQSFIARMRARAADETAENARRALCGLEPLETLYDPPAPGERFQYILAKAGDGFDIRGRKAPHKKGGIMEYAKVARAKNIPIDIALYLKSYLVGLCARFINFSEPFTPPPAARVGLDEKTLDSSSLDAARKYLEVFISRLQNADPEMVRKRGYAYKRAWQRAERECSARLQDRLGPVADILHGRHLDWSAFTPAGEEGVAGVVSALAARAQRYAEASFASAEYATAFAANLGIAADGGDLGSHRTAANLYSAAEYLSPRPRRGGGPTLRTRIVAALCRREAAVRTRLAELVPLIADTVLDYEQYLAKIVDVWRAREHAERPEDLGERGGEPPPPPAGFAPDELAVARLQEIRELWYALFGIFRVRACHVAIGARLDGLKDSRLPPAAPDPATQRRLVADSAARIPPLGIGMIGDGGY